MTDLKQLYTKRAKEYEAKAARFESRYNRLSLFRLALFIIGLGVFIYLTTLQLWIALLFALLFVTLFVRFVQWHLKIQQQQFFNEAMSVINQRELAALEGNYSDFGDGRQFVDPLHPYTVDLDIFGPFSFFQFSNRTCTAIGEEQLAAYLTEVVTINEIGKRQQAIAELQNKLDWRQEFQATGGAAQDDIRHVRTLIGWLGAPDFMLNNKKLQLALWLIPLWMALGLFLFIFYIPWQAALLFLVPPIMILRRTLERVNTAHQQTTHVEKILSHYARLVKFLEGGDFHARKLRTLQSAFLTDDRKASESISRLSYIISQLNVRYNAFAFILNIFGLWDLQWIYRLEKWKAAEKENLPAWFRALGEMEALNSFATIYYNNPDWQMPVISDEKQLIARELGHPLILPSKRISNDLDLPTTGHIKLVTGSNMAGKSTFLRTVGINIVIAMSGAPVCARSFSLPQLEVYTSMRTQDALHESTSSFYAELKRLKMIIEAVENRENVFFLLDEILKGTNSNDRHTGSKALIRQLIKSGGSGIIATHDLELGAMEATAGGAIENLCMEVDIRDGQLDFDYKIKKGVSKSFNASLLMKEMGIKIYDEQE